MLSGELYCRVYSLILKTEQAASFQSHQSVIQALSRKGIYVVESDGTPVADEDLSSMPIKMVSAWIDNTSTRLGWQKTVGLWFIACLSVNDWIEHVRPRLHEFKDPSAEQHSWNGLLSNQNVWFVQNLAFVSRVSISNIKLVQATTAFNVIDLNQLHSTIIREWTSSNAD